MWVAILRSDLVGISGLSQTAPVQRSFFFPGWAKWGGGGGGGEKVHLKITFHPLQLAGS